MFSFSSSAELLYVSRTCSSFVSLTCSYTVHDGVFHTSYWPNATALPPTSDVPPPWMQKFTCDELWRVGRVRSPGFRTHSETAVPFASAWPAPLAGLRMAETRRPLAGA